jgi:hypothetical protein
LARARGKSFWFFFQKELSCLLILNPEYEMRHRATNAGATLAELERPAAFPRRNPPDR